MNSTFERFESASALESYLINDALERYDNLFGQPAYGGYWPGLYRDDIALLPAAAVEFATAAVPESQAVAIADTTNTQVDGVDEADLIETDGEFLYQVNGQAVTIVDATEPADLAIASQFTLTPPWLTQNRTDSSTPSSSTTTITRLPVEPLFPIGGPVGGWSNIDGIYLQGDRLTVIASGYTFAEPDASEQRSLYSGFPSKPQVQVTVLDVADPTQVSLLETSILEGSLVSSRAIGDDVVVVTNQEFQLPAPLIVEPEPADSVVKQTDPDDLSTSALPEIPLYPFYPYPRGSYETKAAYLERMDGQVLTLGLPEVETFDGHGNLVDSGFLSAATEIYQPLTQDDVPNAYAWQQLTTVSTFDVGDGHRGVDASASIPTEWINEVFVSQDSLYLLKQTYRAGAASTEILKFDLETSALVATGQVPGRIDSQFSVDEHEGFLRITTTTNFGLASRNNIYVLDQNNDRLDVVGKVEGLAPGERIFSTRFQGDYGFVVTFRQVDPLFTLDLSDPHNPKVSGELKIPGFSEYLQVIQQGEQTLLLGIGRDADPITGRAGALKVSLFDVTDLENPVEIDNHLFEGDYSSSQALWDHKAVTYVPGENLLAIPTQAYGDGFGSFQTQLSVFRVDAEAGLTSLGTVEHGTNVINRSVSIEETLYAFSQQQISAYNINDLERLGEVAWTGDDIADLSWNAGESFFGSGFLEAERSGIAIAPNPSSDSLPGTENDDAIAGGAGDDKLYGNGGQDFFFGGDGNDEIVGGMGSDIAFGGAGNDVIYGNGARDILLGNAGDDTLMGSDGDDVLVGGAGSDRLTGGSGSDVFVYGQATGTAGSGTGSMGTDIIEDFRVGIDVIGLVAGSLMEADITRVQEGMHTVLGVVNGEERLAVLKYVQAGDLQQTSFVTLRAIGSVEQAASLL